MHYFFQDLTGIAAATPLALILLLLPGFGITSLMVQTGLIEADSNRACWPLVLAPTLLPALDVLLVRWLGFGAMLALHLALAGLGARLAMETVRRLPARLWLAILACWLAAVWANADFDWHGRLYQSASVVDGVKHAAVVGSLTKYGVPLHDPFVARAGIAGYYFYFYIGPALIHWIGGPLIDSRAAFAAGTFVTLLAFPAMLMLVADAAALIPDGDRSRFQNFIIVLCCASGLDLLPGIWILATMGHVLAQLDWWSEEVRWALTSVLWQPHHMTAVIALFTGCLLSSANPRSNLFLRSFIAGLAFATAFGCSVWIAIGALPVLALWWLYERAKLGTASMWVLPVSGVAALFLSLPQIGDIEAGRIMAGPPLALYLRPVGPVRVLPHSLSQWIVHLAVVPGGYLIEFGVFALGAIAFLKSRHLAETRSTPIGRLLFVSLPVALVLVTFVRSAVLYNDFGWRAIWLAQVPAMLWTASILTSQRQKGTHSPLMTGALALGLAATVWDMAGLRLFCPDYFPSFVNAHPAVDYDLRGAYRWVDRNLSANVLVQHNPTGEVRAMDFGLYSDRPVAVADRDAQLFGASQPLVENRLLLLGPVFSERMPAPELRERAAAAGVGAILLTSEDPLWRTYGAPPPGWTCRYRSLHSCIMLVEEVK